MTQNHIELERFELNNGDINNHVVLIGARGHGKSTCGNVLTGQKLFQITSNKNKVSNSFQVGIGKFYGIPFSVLDTPGLNDNISNDFKTSETILQKIKEDKNMKNFIIVVDSNNSIISQRIGYLLQLISNAYEGYPWVKHISVLFTNFDYSEKRRIIEAKKNECIENFKEFFQNKFNHIVSENDIDEIHYYFADTINALKHKGLSYESMYSMARRIANLQPLQHYTEINEFLNMIIKTEVVREVIIEEKKLEGDNVKIIQGLYDVKRKYMANGDIITENTLIGEKQTIVRKDQKVLKNEEEIKEIRTLGEIQTVVTGQDFGFFGKLKRQEFRTLQIVKIRKYKRNKITLEDNSVEYSNWIQFDEIEEQIEI